MGKRPLYRLLGLAALAAVLALAFLGYLGPAMRTSWETVASLCGF